MKKKHKNLLLSTIESRRTNYFKWKKMADYIDGICTLFIKKLRKNIHASMAGINSSHRAGSQIIGSSRHTSKQEAVASLSGQ